MFKKRKFIGKNGFSLLEAVLSIFILSTAMVSVLGLMASNLRNSIDTMDQEIAGFLAQEGTELMRNLRDTNWKNNNVSFCHFPGTSAEYCRVDKDSDNSVDIDCDNGNDEHKRLRLDPSGFYTHGNSPFTKFSRKIEVAYLKNDETSENNRNDAYYAKITSMVIWGGDWPENDIADCNTANKCAFTQVTLSKWGNNCENIKFQISKNNE